MLAIPLMLTTSETIKPSTVILQMRTNTSFANNPWYKPKKSCNNCKYFLLKQGGEKLQYHTPLILESPGKGFSTFLFPSTNESFISLLSFRICITVSLQGMTTWYSFRSPSVDILESCRPIQGCLLIVFSWTQKGFKFMQKVKTSFKFAEFLLNLSYIESHDIFVTRNSAISSQREKMLNA